MKKFTSIIMVAFLTFSYAQNADRNRFDNVQPLEESYDQDDKYEANRGPGSPGEPVPIDDYLPLLVIAAVGIIIYNTHTRKRNAC